jgi:hypothetical protein
MYADHRVQVSGFLGIWRLQSPQPRKYLLFLSQETHHSSVGCGPTFPGTRGVGDSRGWLVLLVLVNTSHPRMTRGIYFAYGVGHSHA